MLEWCQGCGEYRLFKPGTFSPWTAVTGRSFWISIAPSPFFSCLGIQPLPGVRKLTVGTYTVAGPFLSTEEQYVSDILNYIEHGDPQVRGATAILCGTLVCSVLRRCRFHVAAWMGAVRARTGNHQPSAFSIPCRRSWTASSCSGSHEGVCACSSGQEIHFLWRTAFPCCRRL